MKSAIFYIVQFVASNLIIPTTSSNKIKNGLKWLNW